MSNKISYIKHKNIDKEKWDNCIDNSKNRIVYALSWYLDRLCPNWDALIENDYETVMPIVHKKKILINYIYNPFFSARLGVFSIKKIDSELINSFFLLIPAKFKLINIRQNSYHSFSIFNFKSFKNVTYELSLQKPFKELIKNYSKNHKKNIHKSYKSKIVVKKEQTLSGLLLLKKELIFNVKNNKVTSHHFKKLYNILILAQQKGFLHVYNAYDEEGKICGSAGFLIKYNRAIKFSATNETGKQNRVGYLLIDVFLKDFAGNDLILDFAGSNIKGIADFNSGFGSSKNFYYNYSRNKLKFPFSLIKK